jgi:hypothetical protein
MFLKSSSVLHPIVVWLEHDFRMPKLKKYVIKIIREAVAKKALDVFKQESPWAKFANRPNRLGKHIARIKMRQMLARDRKRLTRRTTRH